MAWGAILRAFPGSFPPAVFDTLTLEQYADTYHLALTFLEMEADAIRQAQRG